MRAPTRNVLVTLCLAALPIITTVASAHAVPTKAEVCPDFTKAGVTFHWSTVGTGFTCSSAKKYVVKLSSEHFPQSDGQVKLTGGPKSYHCLGTIDKNGRATVGACYLGTVAFPKSGFQWLG
jgi:hypothetical protein